MTWYRRVLLLQVTTGTLAYPHLVYVRYTWEEFLRLKSMGHHRLSAVVSSWVHGYIVGNGLIAERANGGMIAYLSDPLSYHNFKIVHTQVYRVQIKYEE